MSRKPQAQYEAGSSNGKLSWPVGQADAALLFDNQSDEPSALELLTAPEAAAFLTISVSSMRSLQHARRVPFFKVGGSIRFAKTDLLAYLARQRVGSLGK